MIIAESTTGLRGYVIPSSADDETYCSHVVSNGRVRMWNSFSAATQASREAAEWETGDWRKYREPELATYPADKVQLQD